MTTPADVPPGDARIVDAPIVDAPIFDEDCSPTKTCRNMQGVTFDGFADPGTDIGDAWRERLRREGKLAAPGTSIRDLVLGSVSTPGAAG